MAEVRNKDNWRDQGIIIEALYEYLLMSEQRHKYWQRQREKLQKSLDNCVIQALFDEEKADVKEMTASCLRLVEKRLESFESDRQRARELFENYVELLEVK